MISQNSDRNYPRIPKGILSASLERFFQDPGKISDNAGMDSPSILRGYFPELFIYYAVYILLLTFYYGDIQSEAGSSPRNPESDSKISRFDMSHNQVCSSSVPGSRNIYLFQGAQFHSGNRNNKPLYLSEHLVYVDL